MFDDPIVRETRKYREEYAASLGYDLDRIVADLQSRQGRDGRVVVNRASQGKSEPADAGKNSMQPALSPESAPRTP